MNRLSVAGLLSLALGVVGYAAGIADPYTGAGFAVTAIMVGITLLAIRRVDPGGTE